MCAARSTIWEINNETDQDLELFEGWPTEGVWVKEPPDTIETGTTTTFIAESNGLLSGDAASVIYQSTAGVWNFYFRNTMIGEQEFNVLTPDNYGDTTTHAAGNDQYLTSRCFKLS